MTRRRLWPGVVLLGVVWIAAGCGGNSAKPTPPTVYDPNAITVPKAAGGGPKAG